MFGLTPFLAFVFHSLILSCCAELFFPGHLGSIFTDVQPDLGRCLLVPKTLRISLTCSLIQTACVPGVLSLERIGLYILLL